jgi:hypothetical protein
MTNRATAACLRIELLSDATFSRREGTAGIVDTEVEHDDLGMPFISGRTVRGLLRDSWLSMSPHFAQSDCSCNAYSYNRDSWLSMSPHFAALSNAAARVLGRSQATDDSCRLRIGDASLPAGMRATLQQAANRPDRPLAPAEILVGFTTIRYQTAEDRETGAPAASTLRSSRVVLRGFAFESRLMWLDGYNPTEADLQLLALCALATRHGGLLRNRGRGHIRITIDGDLETTRSHAEGTK